MDDTRNLKIVVTVNGQQVKSELRDIHDQGAKIQKTLGSINLATSWSAALAIWDHVVPVLKEIGGALGHLIELGHTQRSALAGLFGEEDLRRLHEYSSEMLLLTGTPTTTLEAALGKISKATHANAEELEIAGKALIGLKGIYGSYDVAANKVIQTINYSGKAIKALGEEVDKNATGHDRLNQLVRLTNTAFETEKAKVQDAWGQWSILKEQLHDSEQYIGGILNKSEPLQDALSGINTIVHDLVGNLATWIEQNPVLIQQLGTDLATAVLSSARAINVLLQAGAYLGEAFDFSDPSTQAHQSRKKNRDELLQLLRQSFGQLQDLQNDINEKQLTANEYLDTNRVMRTYGGADDAGSPVNIYTGNNPDHLDIPGVPGLEGLPSPGDRTPRARAERFTLSGGWNGPLASTYRKIWGGLQTRGWLLGAQSSADGGVRPPGFGPGSMDILGMQPGLAVAGGGGANIPGLPANWQAFLLQGGPARGQQVNQGWADVPSNARSRAIMGNLQGATPAIFSGGHPLATALGAIGSAYGPLGGLAGGILGKGLEGLGSVLGIGGRHRRDGQSRTSAVIVEQPAVEDLLTQILNSTQAAQLRAAGLGLDQLAGQLSMDNMRAGLNPALGTA